MRLFAVRDRTDLDAADALQCQHLALQGVGTRRARSQGDGAPTLASAADSRDRHRSISCLERYCEPDVWSRKNSDPWPIAPARSAFHQCEVRVSEADDSVTGLIRAWGDGDQRAGDQLFGRVYGELRLIARRLRRRSAMSGDQTLETTALVHEVYLRLAGASELSVENRSHFFAVAVRATRQIVSNYARDAKAQKRGGGVVTDTLDGRVAEQIGGVAPDDVAGRIGALDAALRELEQLHPRPCRVVECRYFGGLSIPETALALDISEATVKRDWAVAQAWLHRALRDADVTGHG